MEQVKFQIDPEDLNEGRYDGEPCYFAVVRGTVGDFSQKNKETIEKESGQPFFPWYSPIIGQTRQMIVLLFLTKDGGTEIVNHFFLDNEDGTGLEKVTNTHPHELPYRLISPSAVQSTIKLKKYWRKYTPELYTRVNVKLRKLWAEKDPEQFKEIYQSQN